MTHESTLAAVAHAPAPNVRDIASATDDAAYAARATARVGIRAVYARDGVADAIRTAAAAHEAADADCGAAVYRAVCVSLEDAAWAAFGGSDGSAEYRAADAERAAALLRERARHAAADAAAADAAAAAAHADAIAAAGAYTAAMAAADSGVARAYAGMHLAARMRLADAIADAAVRTATETAAAAAAAAVYAHDATAAAAEASTIAADPHTFRMAAVYAADAIAADGAPYDDETRRAAAAYAETMRAETPYSGAEWRAEAEAAATEYRRTLGVWPHPLGRYVL